MSIYNTTFSLVFNSQCFKVKKKSLFKSSIKFGSRGIYLRSKYQAGSRFHDMQQFILKVKHGFERFKKVRLEVQSSLKVM